MEKYIMFTISKAYYGISCSKPESFFQLQLFSNKSIEEFQYDLNLALSLDNTDSELILHYRDLINQFIELNYYEKDSTKSIINRNINDIKNYTRINQFTGNIIRF